MPSIPEVDRRPVLSDDEQVGGGGRLLLCSRCTSDDFVAFVGVVGRGQKDGE